MCWRGWNKMFVISFSVASAGILVCIAAMLDNLVPKSAVLGFLMWAIALVVTITLVLTGYVWVCDKCEDYLSGRFERLLNRHQEAARKAARTSRKTVDATSRAGQRVVVLRFQRHRDLTDESIHGASKGVC
jgi:hypothetical protein